MTTTAFDLALRQLRTALILAPQDIPQANLAVRSQLDALRRQPASLSAEQMQHARRQLLELAELARLRQHTVRRLQHALSPDNADLSYGRRGALR